MRNPSHFPRFLTLKLRTIPLQGLKYPALLLAALLLLAPAIRAQQTQAPTSSPQRSVPGLSSSPTPPDNNIAHMAERMARERNSDRQKEIVADTARLLKLAQQLNVDVSKTNKDTLSLNVVREAGEIEKLAKTVKDKMKEGY